jgi:release factor glutamine methyltransferase
MTIEVANRLLIASLDGLYDEREAAAICSLVMEHLTGMPKGMRLSHKEDILIPGKEEQYRKYLSELLGSRPVQYVLGEAWFGNLSFYVDENVLIPRPETEELVEWLLSDNPAVAGKTDSGVPVSVLDIGTGSGCIGVYIKKKRADFELIALDVSETALDIAKKNAQIHGVDISYALCDIRNNKQWEKIPATDLIISNPPYIPEKQKQALDKHVRDFEPGLALFVPDDDPILFYHLIADIAKEKLKPGGKLYLEIHHDFAGEIRDWYDRNGFSVELKKDFSGNNRMIKAQLT